jgi:hypothetical protein
MGDIDSKGTAVDRDITYVYGGHDLIKAELVHVRVMAGVRAVMMSLITGRCLAIPR